MTLFQAIFVPVFLVSLAWTIVRTTSGRLPRRAGLAWSLFWLAATLLSADPELSSRISRVFGIGRGLDLVLALSVVAGAYVALALYGRTRRLEKAITELARHQALAEAARGGSAPEETKRP